MNQAKNSKGGFMKQEELGNMPDKSALGLAGEHFLEMKDKREAASANLERAGAELAEAFVKAKKFQVRVKDKLITFSQDLKTQIKVVSPREP